MPTTHLYASWLCCICLSHHSASQAICPDDWHLPCGTCGYEDEPNDAIGEIIDDEGDLLPTGRRTEEEEEGLALGFVGLRIYRTTPKHD